MLTDVSRIITTMLALSLIPGCRGLESEARLAVPDDVRASDTETSRTPRARRQPKTQIETSLTDGDGLTFGTARISVAAMLPVNPPDRMLLVKPNFAAHSLESPLDTPSRLYSAGINMMWLEKLNDRTTLTIALNPALSGDDAEFGRHLRVFAMGAVAWDWIPDELRVTAGAAWLGRRDIGVVPAAGLEWTPNDDWNVSLILPRPRVSRRLFDSETSEAWLYAAGSLNGGTFDVRRGDGSADELSLREFQTSVGLELTNSQIGRGFLEVGAGFGRELQFESRQDAISFGPGLALRLGLTR